MGSGTNVSLLAGPALTEQPGHFNHLISISIWNGENSGLDASYTGISLVLLWRHPGGGLMLIVELADIAALAALTL